MTRLRFEPKEDITTYELAQIVKLSTMMQQGDADVIAYMASLPGNVMRHLIVKKDWPYHAGGFRHTRPRKEI